MGFTGGGNNGNDDSAGFSFPMRNLSVWWSEETDYLLQRIERWAAYARGYNRLRSARLSPGRMTMHESGWGRESPPPPRGTATTAIVGGGASEATKPIGERQRLRCCALDYKSNGNIDTGCLEAYSLDHSIYFKTIGEIRSEQLRSASNDARSRPSTQQLDCGDFLASDFDELEEDDDAEDSELEALGEELREQLEAACAECEQRPDLVRLRGSVIDEDEINNNFTLVGYPRIRDGSNDNEKSIVATARRHYHRLQPTATAAQ